MKKILLASAATLALTGYAAADVRVAGDANMGVNYNGVAWAIDQSVRLTFTGTTETDHGVALTGFFRMTDGAFDRQWVRVSAEGLTLTVGGTNGAIRSLARTGIFYGYNRGGVWAADTTVGIHTDGAGNVAYASYAADAFTVGASVNVTGAANYEIAGRYSMDGLTVAAGFGTGNIWAIHGSYAMGDITAMIGYNSASVLVVGGSYAMGDITVGAALQNSGAGTRYGANVGYNLGGGASIQGTIGRTEAAATVAGLGLTFAF